MPPAALEPAPEWARLRADCPVAPVQLASGDQVMLLTRYEDVRAVLADPRCIRDLGAEAAQITATESKVFDNSRTGGMDAEAMRTLSGNGPGHQRWRRLLSRSFTAKRAQALEPRMEQIAEHLLDEMIASGSPADLRPAFAFPCRSM